MPRDKISNDRMIPKWKNWCVNQRTAVQVTCTRDLGSCHHRGFRGVETRRVQDAREKFKHGGSVGYENGKRNVSAVMCQSV